MDDPEHPWHGVTQVIVDRSGPGHGWQGQAVLVGGAFRHDAGQLLGWGGWGVHEPETITTTERIFLNVYGAQESIPRHQFRQPM